jgi:DNA polymerase-3 subunit delta
MIFFLYGPDTYRSRLKLKELKEKFLTDVDSSALNLTVLEGDKIKIEEFSSAISTPPFLARKRMVVVTNLLTQNKNKEIGKQVVELLEKENLIKDILLVFWEGEKADERTVLFKRLISEKYAQRFDFLKDHELKNWVRLEVKRQGGSISTPAIDKLVELVGNDLWEMFSEISKLVAYKDKTTIESQDVVALVKGKFDDNIFNFVDAIAAKNKKLAHHLLTDQLNSGANESYLLAMLIRQFRILLQVKSLTEGQRIVASVVASELKIHPFVAQKALYQIKNFSENKLKEIYSQLLAADAKIKTNLADTKVLFDLLLTKIMN